MEAGKDQASDQIIADLVDAMMGADPRSPTPRAPDRAQRLPHLRLLLRHVHRQLDELPDRGTGSLPAGQRLPAGDPRRSRAAVRAGRPHRQLAKPLVASRTMPRALPRNIATKAAFENAMALDIAMGGSTNTVLHLLAQEAGVDFTMADIDRMSRKVPQLCKVAPSTQKYHMEDVHRAGGVVAILGQLETARAWCTADTRNVLGPSLVELLAEWDVSRSPAMTRGTTSTAQARPASAPPDRSVRIAAGPSWIWTAPRGASAPSSTPTARKVAWRCCWQPRPQRGHRQDRRVDEEPLETFRGPARVFESQESRGGGGIPGWHGEAGEVVVIRYEGPRAAPACRRCSTPPPIQVRGLGKVCALITDGRFRRHLGSLHRPRLPGGGLRWRHYRSGGGWRHHQHRHPGPQHGAGGGRQRAGGRRAAVSARGWKPVDRQREVSFALRAYACSPPAPTRARCAIAPCWGVRMNCEDMGALRALRHETGYKPWSLVSAADYLRKVLLSPVYEAARVTLCKPEETLRAARQSRQPEAGGFCNRFTPSSCAAPTTRSPP